MMETKVRTYKGKTIEPVVDGYVVRLPFGSHGAEWDVARCPYFPSIRAAEKAITEDRLTLRPVETPTIVRGRDFIQNDETVDRHVAEDATI